MDGFAVRAHDISGASGESPVILQVVGDVPAGIRSDVAVQAGQSARLMTGGVIPEGADAIAPVEITNFGQRGPGWDLPAAVAILKPVHTGDYIRPIGQDIRQSQAVLKKGAVLRPQDVGILCMLGQQRTEVNRKPKSGHSFDRR